MKLSREFHLLIQHRCRQQQHTVKSDKKFRSLEPVELGFTRACPPSLIISGGAGGWLLSPVSCVPLQLFTICDFDC